jgi:hypothetical protein
MAAADFKATVSASFMKIITNDEAFDSAFPDCNPEGGQMHMPLHRGGLGIAELPCHLSGRVQAAHFCSIKAARETLPQYPVSLDRPGYCGSPGPQVGDRYTPWHFAIRTGVLITSSSNSRRATPRASATPVHSGDGWREV